MRILQRIWRNKAELFYIINILLMSGNLDSATRHLGSSYKALVFGFCCSLLLAVFSKRIWVRYIGVSLGTGFFLAFVPVLEFNRFVSVIYALLLVVTCLIPHVIITPFVGLGSILLLRTYVGEADPTMLLGDTIGLSVTSVAYGLLVYYFRELEKDIEKRKQVEQELQNSQAQLQSIMNNVDVVIWSVDTLDQKVLHCSTGTDKVYGMDVQWFYESPNHWLELVHPEDLPKVQAVLAGIEAEQDSTTCDFRIVKQATQEERWLQTELVAVRNQENKLVRLDGVTLDITERKLTEAKINYLAYHDVLTGLTNRSVFAECLDRALLQAQKAGYFVAVIFLDIDRFKLINDTLGHSFGDSVIKSVADRLKSINIPHSLLSRQGGDEFTIYIDQLPSKGQVAKYVEGIFQVLQEPYYIDGHEIFISFSIGISLFPTDGEQAEVLLKNADIAMYEAKGQGKNRYLFYTHGMNEAMQRKSMLEKALRKAMELEEFVLFYQPQVEILTGKIVGVEALLRWNKPGVGMVAPDEFIPICDETGLIIVIGEWVLNTACQAMANWQRVLGNKQLSLSVNLSAVQLQQDNIIAAVERALAISGLPPSSLELEITESIGIVDLDLAKQRLKALKLLGVKVSMDDFGTGYSSLNYLKHFGVDTLKIDKSFINDMLDNRDNEALVSAIIALARSMKLKVVAEGVESKGQLDLLQSLGCQLVQGNLYCEPLSTDKITNVLTKPLSFSKY